jgi:hypothetical protein
MLKIFNLNGARPGQVALLALDLLILLVTGEVQVTQGSTRSGCDLLELLLLLLAPEAVLLLIVALAVVVPLDVVILIRLVELLPLGVVDHVVGGVTALKASPM